MRSNKTGWLLLLLWLCLGCNDEFVIMSYNVQNLFDDVADGSEYPEYIPGKGKWNTWLYERKLQAIARVIKAAVPGGAEILVLQEIENKKVLDRLNNRYLANLGYTSAVLVPVTGSATNVALLSRHRLVSTKSHNLKKYQGNALRGILEVEVEYEDHSLHIFNNHWKSQSGGEEKTEPARISAAALVKKRITALLLADPTADILVAGDLNENTTEYLDNKKKYQTALIPAKHDVPESFYEDSLFLAAEPQECGLYEDKLVFFEPWYQIPMAARGNYYYRNQWQTLDHMLISSGLFDNTGFHYIGFEVIKKGFLLNNNTGVPLAWRNDGTGYSDHLPIIIKLGIHKVGDES